MNFSSTLFFSLSRHRTIKHCHKAELLKQLLAKTKRDAAIQFTGWHDESPFLHSCKYTLPGERREGWQWRRDETAAGWIYTVAGAAKQIDQESQTLRGGEKLYNYCAATCLKHSFVFIALQVSKNRHPGDTLSHGRLNKPPGSRGASFSEVMERKRWKQSSQAQAHALILCWDQLLFLDGARTFLGMSSSFCSSRLQGAQLGRNAVSYHPLKSNLIPPLDMIAWHSIKCK